MKHTLLAIVALFTCSLSFGQSFEGRLVYKVELEMETRKFGGIEITKEQVIEKMKKEGEYFDSLTVTIKQGNYLKEDNSRLQKRIIYKADANKIYTLEKDFEYVLITNAANYNARNISLQAPEVEQIDSLKTINGYACKLVTLSWGSLSEEQYFYTTEVAALNPELFKNHNYEYFNTLIATTGAYPLEIVKKVNGFMTIRMTLVTVSEGKVDDEMFALPKLKEADAEYTNLVKMTTGLDVMEIDE